MNYDYDAKTDGDFDGGDFLRLGLASLDQAGLSPHNQERVAKIIIAALGMPTSDPAEFDTIIGNCTGGLS